MLRLRDACIGDEVRRMRIRRRIRIRRRGRRESFKRKRVQNGGRNGVFSDGPMGAAAPNGFGRKNPVRG